MGFAFMFPFRKPMLILFHPCSCMTPRFAFVIASDLVHRLPAFGNFGRVAENRNHRGPETSVFVAPNEDVGTSADPRQI